MAESKKGKNPHEAAEDQGFFGVKVDPLPNKEHSLESGPKSPVITKGPDQPAEYIKQRSDA